MSRQNKSEIRNPKFEKSILGSLRAEVGVVVLLFGAVALFVGCNSQTPSPPTSSPGGIGAGPEISETTSSGAEGTTEATSAQVHQFCGACHAYPPPETFPRSDWRFEVMQGYGFYEHSNYDNPRLR